MNQALALSSSFGVVDWFTGGWLIGRFQPRQPNNQSLIFGRFGGAVAAAGVGRVLIAQFEGAADFFDEFDIFRSDANATVHILEQGAGLRTPAEASFVECLDLAFFHIGEWFVVGFFRANLASGGQSRFLSGGQTALRVRLSGENEQKQTDETEVGNQIFH